MSKRRTVVSGLIQASNPINDESRPVAATAWLYDV